MTTDELKALLAERGPIFVVSREDVVELIALREREARLVEALRPFSAMASEMFAANWNYDDVAIGFVTREGPLRLTFKEFCNAHTALAEIEKEAGE